MKLLIKNGTVVTPEGEKKADLLIENGLIAAISPDIREKCDVLNAEGKYLFPGMIDMHVHLREPGFEGKEDIESGCHSQTKFIAQVVKLLFQCIVHAYIDVCLGHKGYLTFI